MRKLIFSLTVITLFIFASGSLLVLAQDKSAKPVTKNGDVVYLAELKPDSMIDQLVDKDYLTGHWFTGTSHMDGQEYAHTIAFGNGASNTTWTVFLINRQYDWFDVTIGVSDKQPSRNAKFKFTINAPGQKLYQSEEMIVGDKPVPLHLAVKNVVRLTLQMNVSDYDYVGYACWGNARLVKDNPPIPKPNIPEPDPQEKDKKKPVPAPEPSGETFTFDILAIENLARKLKEQVEDDKDQFKTKPVEVAVASFDLIPTSLSPDNARKVREQLSNALIKTKTFRVVERAQTDKILDELKRSTSDLTDKAKALSIGKQTNARAVLVGSISDEKTYIIVNVRMINTETGESTIAESVEVKKR